MLYYSMIIQNKYSFWYYNIIESARHQNRVKFNGVYYENHHILPKSLKGSNNIENLVLLTAKEHFVCHHLLTKFTIGDGKRSMDYAFFQMFTINPAQCERYLPPASLYDVAKQNMAIATSTLHKNKTFSENYKTKIREGLSIGTFITPWGEFKNIGSALKDNKCMSNMSLSRYCQNANSKLTIKSQIQSSYFSSTDIGRTFKDLGFGFNLNN